MAIDLSKFSVNQREGEYSARIRVEGEVLIHFKAGSIEEAKERAEAEADKIADDNYGGVELDDVHDVSVDYVYAEGPMYRVIRDGRSMQVGRVLDTDQPREPDERGF